jgi:superfamily II DNA or RNA helicase
VKEEQIFEIEDRQFQINDQAAIEKAWQEYQSLIYQLPTGGGKSVVVTKIVSDYRNENIIIFAHKRKLLKQMRNQLSKMGIKAGVLAGTLQDNLDSNILIVSIRTAVKDARLEWLLKRKWDKCIIDEARHSRTASYDTVLDAFKSANPLMRLLGCDATPYRKDRKRLDKHFQHMIVSEENVASLTVKGFLQSCKVIVSPIDKESLKESVKEVANDYQMTELSTFMRQEKYLDYMVNQYKQYGEERSCIAFAVDKAHARDLKERFIKGGYTKVAQIDSDMSAETIEQVYEDFENNKVQILINIEMATEGVDLPTCGCILGGRPTKSLTLYLQMGGRGMRPDGVHNYFILLDCCGWTDEFGTLSSPKHWSLNPEIDPNNNRKKNKIVGRKTDGTFTEDLTDFIGEVVEMTPEEYIAQLSGGLEGAQKVNFSLDEKIQIELEKIKQTLKKKAVIDNHFSYYWRLESNQMKLLIAYSDDGYVQEEHRDQWYWRKYLTIDFDKVKECYAFISHDSYAFRLKDSTHKPYMFLSTLVGKINEKLMTTDMIKTLKEHLEQIEELEKSKIDLDLFRRATETFANERFEKQIMDTIKLTGEIRFESGACINEDDLFKGYSGNAVIGIRFASKNIVGYHNKIELICIHRRDRSEIKKEIIVAKNYVKGDKVWEIIRKGIKK